MADYFGSNLTDLQSGMSATEAEQGAIKRQRIASDAQKKAAFYGMISNKAKTEAQSRADEAANAQKYFEMNLKDAQEKAKIAAQAQQLQGQWTHSAQLEDARAQNEMAKQKVADKAAMDRTTLLTNTDLGLAKIQYPYGDPSIYLEKERQKQYDIVRKATVGEFNLSAKNLAGRANIALQRFKQEYSNKMKSANDTIAGGEMNERRSMFPWRWTDSSAPQLRFDKFSNEADQDFNTSITTILERIDPTGESITFDTSRNQFVPVIRGDQSVIPSSIPNFLETNSPPAPNRSLVPMIRSGIPTTINQPGSVIRGPQNNVMNFIRDANGNIVPAP